MMRTSTLDGQGSSRLGLIGSVTASVVVLALGAAAYFSWDNWWVNWDGGFYLYLGRSIHDGHGLTFPDGSPAYFRGPGYPALFALGWSMVEVSAKTAIWMSRSVLLGVGLLVSLMIGHAGTRWSHATIAGLAAVAPSLVMESGGWYFVPDGLAAGLVVGAVALMSVPVRVGSGYAMGAGLLMSLAVLTKETAFLFVPIVLLVMWVATRKDDPAPIIAAGAYLMGFSVSVLAWIIWAAARGGPDLRFVPVPIAVALTLLSLVAIVGVLAIALASEISLRLKAPSAPMVTLLGVPTATLGTLVLLTAFGEPLILSQSEGLFDAWSRLAVSFGWSWVPALVVLVGSVVARPPRGGGAIERLWVAGWLLVAIGAGQAWYAGSAALSMRNAVTGVFGVAILLGATLHTVTRAGRLPVKAISWLVAVAFVGLAAANTGELDRVRDNEQFSWDNAAVHELRAWLDGNEGESVRVSPVYATYTWFLGGDLPDPVLLEMHGAPAGNPSYEAADFCKRVWWAGDIPSCPSSEVVRTAAANRRIVSAVFTDAIQSGPRLTILTGNVAAGAAFDGDVLVYMIEKFDLGEPIFATGEAHLPHWAMVYELDESAWSDPLTPAVVEPGLDGMSRLAPEAIEFDSEDFEAILRDVLP